MDKISVSIVIIVFNEERNLPDCLASVKWAKEIVVVDGFSTDHTVDIAKKYTDKIFKREMDVEGRHRNFAYAQATQEWILSLDADERVSPELAEELKEVVTKNDPEISAYSIPIKTFMGKRWIKAAGYYPARKLRMHRKGKFRYEESAVHPRAFLDGKESRLKGDILHYGYRNFAHFTHKLNNQTSLEAEKWIEDGRKVNGPKILYKCFDRFVRNYIGKKGYQDGFLGFMMCVFHGLYQLQTYTKYLEFKQMHAKKIIFIDRDGVINEDIVGDYIKSWNDFKFIPGALTSLRKLSKAGYGTIIVSNQAGIGDGAYPESSLRDVTKRMLEELKRNSVNVSGVYYCLHGKEAGCDCRKPKTGLFEEASREIKFDPTQVFFIGDKASDVEAGKKFGLKTLFVLTGHGVYDQPKLAGNLKPEKIFPSINEAVDYIIERK